MGKELGASKVFFINAFLFQELNYLGFRSDRGMVSPRNPAGIFALHSSTADEDILYGIVEHVPHMEHAGDVRRRDDNGVGFLSWIYAGGKQLVFHPVRIPFGLGSCRFVFAGNRHRY